MCEKAERLAASKSPETEELRCWGNLPTYPEIPTTETQARANAEAELSAYRAAKEMEVPGIKERKKHRHETKGLGSPVAYRFTQSLYIFC